MSFPEAAVPLWSDQEMGVAEERRRAMHQHNRTRSACIKVLGMVRRRICCCCFQGEQAGDTVEAPGSPRWPGENSDPVRCDTHNGLAALLSEAGLEFEAAASSVTEADQIIAGVAQLLHQLMVNGESLREEDFESTRRAPSASPLSCSIQCGSLVAEDFDEHIFEDGRTELGYRVGLLRYLGRRSSRRRVISVAGIHSLLRTIVSVFAFRCEISILTVIYVERLLEKNSSLHLTVNNWRPILIAGLHLAMKTWEDVHPWNAEFARYLRHVTGISLSPRGLHILEMRFLVGLEYRVDVAGALYAAYYFSLLDCMRPATPPQRTASDGDRLRAQSDDVLPLGSSLACFDVSDMHFFGEHEWSHGTLSAAVDERATRWARSVSDRAFTEWGVDAGRNLRNLDGGGTQLDDFRLDPHCPFVGSFRHAPRAAPPSDCIPIRQRVKSRSVSLSQSASESSSPTVLRSTVCIPESARH